MNEAAWFTCTDPTPMLDFLRGKASERKLRLFAAKSARLASEWLVHPNSRAAVEASERVAEGVSNPDILAPIYRAAWDVLPLELGSGLHVIAARAAGRAVQEQAYEAAVLTKNEIVGLHAEMEEATVTSEDEQYRMYWIGKAQGESRVVAFLRDIFGNPFRPVTLDPTWLTPTILALAQAAYENRVLPSGTLDNARLAVIADALEDAGCDHADILNHCRQPGEHVRGCWVLDLLLRKT